jgi:hypothetical protein
MYLEDIGQSQLTDYKVYTFNGQARIIQVDYDRFTNHKRQFFDTKWNRLDISWHIESDKKEIKKPSVLNEMIELSEKLSFGFVHLRTDFFIVNDKIYAGELTFFPGTGLGKWMPKGVDEKLGALLDLSELMYK